MSPCSWRVMGWLPGFGGNVHYTFQRQAAFAHVDEFVHMPCLPTVPAKRMAAHRSPRLFAAVANGVLSLRRTERRRRAVINSSPHRWQSRLQPGRRVASPYVYASTALEVNAHICRGQSVSR